MSLLGCGGFAAAQDPPASAGRSEPARLSLTAYVGGARKSPVGSWYGATPDRDHLFLGIHATLNVVGTANWSIAYAPEVVPLLLITNNPRYREIDVPAARQRFTIEDGRGPVAGFALSPLGVEGQRRLTSHWRGYAAGAAGVVWFTRAVPIAEARAFNYTFEFGGGLLWQYRPRDSLRIGYKFHHLSNWYTAPANPGIDGLVVLAGFERKLR